MSVDHHVLRIRRVQFAQVRLDNIERACRAASRSRVHENGNFIAVHQGASQIKASDAEVNHSRLVRRYAFGQPSRNLAAEGVIAQEDVADAGDENVRTRHWSAPSISSDRSGSTSSGEKKKRWPGRRSRPKSLPGSSSRTTAKWIRSS